MDSADSSPMPPPLAPALASKVGGHAGITTTEDGSLVIKPSLPAELAFYGALERVPELAPLRPFVPQFLGTLTLQESLQDATNGLLNLANGTPLSAGAEVDGQQKDDLVLENLVHGFVRPNVLDVKLGTVLYAPDASPEKVARMERTARDTTSLETGVRLTGFQVYDNVTERPVNTPKSYGKALRPAQLQEGISRFFPVGDSASCSMNPVPQSSGLPRATLVRVIRAIRADVQEIRDTLNTIELRMVGGSVLIVYEAEWERASDAIRKYLEKEEECIPEAGEDKEEGEQEENETGDSEDEKLALPFMVKLIDFAHTRLTPGEGPDEGVLKGLDTLLSLLDGRLESLGPLSSPPSESPARE